MKYIISRTIKKTGGVVLYKYIFVSALQPETAASFILVTLLGMVKEPRYESEGNPLLYNWYITKQSRS